MQNSTKIEHRTVPIEELRSDKKTMRGIAIVFDSETRIGHFDEVIRREAVEKALAREPDVRALWNHNNDFVIGRTKSGTLHLAIEQRGLAVEIEQPNTSLGEHFRESVRRGDVDSMSFGFVVLEENYTTRKGGRDLREVLDIELIEVSPVAFPAYTDTELTARGKKTSATLSPVSLNMRKRTLALKRRN